MSDSSVSVLQTAAVGPCVELTWIRARKLYRPLFCGPLHLRRRWINRPARKRVAPIFCRSVVRKIVVKPCSRCIHSSLTSSLMLCGDIYF